MDPNTIELLCRLPRAATLQQLCDLTYQILGNPVFVSDLAHNILAYTRCVEIEDPIWQTNIVESRLDRDWLRQERDVSAVHDRPGEERRPVLVEDGHMPYPRLIQSLLSRGQAVGVMVVTAYFRPFRPEDAELVELISAFLLPKVADAHYRMTGTRQTVETFFLRLLDGTRLSPERVRKRLEDLGYTPRAHTYILSVGMGGHDPETSAGEGLGPLIDAFLFLGSCRVMIYNTTLVCVYGSDEDITDWETQAPQLFALLRQEGLQAGVSREAHGLEALQEYYRQAQTALEIGLRLGRPDRFFHYDSLSSFALFQTLPRSELALYCHQRIQELSGYDAAHGMELCATLQVYLEQAKSLAKTAEILFIHRNTVRYRINKCMELMRTDLEDGNEIFAFILSLRILEYNRKFPSEQQEDPHDRKTL